MTPIDFSRKQLPKICPFLNTQREPNEGALPCQEGKCAMWDPSHNMCAFRAISYSLAGMYRGMP